MRKKAKLITLIRYSRRHKRFNDLSSFCFSIRGKIIRATTIVADNVLTVELCFLKKITEVPLPLSLPSLPLRARFSCLEKPHLSKIAYSPFPMPRCRRVQKFAHLFVSPPLHFAEVYARESSILFPPAFILLSIRLSYFGRTWKSTTCFLVIEAVSR